MSNYIANPSPSEAESLNLAISATFTAEPIEQMLAFWVQELGLRSTIQFAPYNQVFQQLLEPTSLLARNKNRQNESAINILLIRLEDWIGADQTYTQLEKSVNELLSAIQTASIDDTTPLIICITPATPTRLRDSNFASVHQRLELHLREELSTSSTAYLIPSTDCLRTDFSHTKLDNVDHAGTDHINIDYYDAETDKTGHVPYTDVGFARIATEIVRKIAAIRSRPHKVIVLDCDNTLWEGVCGEDGATGVKLSPQFLALQQFMLVQKNEGMLLCLCSKNSEQDALDVFKLRSEMLIQLDDLVTWRINWQAKSENIKSLAEELQLGLDSFIFLDDNPVECAEVEANCPQVTTLLLPQNSDEFAAFLQNCWAFDRLKVTQEDRKRTKLYQQNVQREQFRSKTAGLENFLAGLNLEITFSDLELQHLSRVSQMTQRTNQFNFTTIRRSEAELRDLCLNGSATCWVIEVKDRFGDYGIVSTVIFQIIDNTLWIDTMLLSCRALGRGVERHIFVKLGEYARSHDATKVVAKFIATARNQPAINFLESIHIDNHNGHKDDSDDAGMLYTFPVEYLTSLSQYDAEYEAQSATVSPAISSSSQKNDANSVRIERSKSQLSNRIAKELRTPQQLLTQIRQQVTERPALQEPYVAPQTQIEQSIIDIWCNVLRLDKVGINDSFADLGGSSLQVVQIHSQVLNTFNAELPITQLFALPTVRSLAQYLNNSTNTSVTSSKAATIQSRAERQKKAMARQKQLRTKQ